MSDQPSTTTPPLDDGQPDADAATLTPEPSDAGAVVADDEAAEPIGPADGVMPSREDLPTSGELDAAPLDAVMAESTERSAGSPNDMGSADAMAGEVAAMHVMEPDGEVVDVAAIETAIDGTPADSEAADVGAEEFFEEDGGVDPVRAGMAVDPNVAAPGVTTVPDPVEEPGDTVIDETMQTDAMPLDDGDPTGDDATGSTPVETEQVDTSDLETDAQDADATSPADDLPTTPPADPMVTGVDPGETAVGDADSDDASDDDLDDLLGMAGVDTEQVADEVAAADEAAASAPAAPAVDEPVEEVARRPESLDDVRDRRDLMRLRGRWFVVHTYSGYEQRVKDNLNARVEALDAHDRIFEVHIPTQDVTEFKKGKKQTVAKKFLPGYVLVRMRMDDETWGIVRHTPNVTGFVGSSGSRPAPLSTREVASTLSIPDKVEEATEETADTGAVVETAPARPEIEIDLDVGETIRVTTGPFADFTGTIADINVPQAKLKVLVSVFGRETPIELPFDNVAKI